MRPIVDLSCVHVISRIVSPCVTNSPPRSAFFPTPDPRTTDSRLFPPTTVTAYDSPMSAKDAHNPKAANSPRIENRRAWHDYHILAKLECGMALVGTEVKALRGGHGQLQEAFARVENGELWLYGVHIDPYDKATAAANHIPVRSRRLLAHRREIRRLAQATLEKGTTLIPLAIYFKDGRAKLELGVAKGKQVHDKRAAIRKKEQDRDLRRATMKRQ